MWPICSTVLVWTSWIVKVAEIPCGTVVMNLQPTYITSLTLCQQMPPNLDYSKPDCSITLKNCYVDEGMFLPLFNIYTTKMNSVGTILVRNLLLHLSDAAVTLKCYQGHKH